MQERKGQAEEPRGSQRCKRVSVSSVFNGGNWNLVALRVAVDIGLDTILNLDEEGKTGRAHGDAIWGRRIWWALDDLRPFGTREQCKAWLEGLDTCRGLGGFKGLKRDHTGFGVSSRGGGWYKGGANCYCLANRIPGQANPYKATSGGASASNLKGDNMPGSSMQGLGIGTRHDVPHQAISKIFRFADDAPPIAAHRPAVNDEKTYLSGGAKFESALCAPKLRWILDTFSCALLNSLVIQQR
ncbi:hypothetical protein DFH09DRAFT_1270283 [Mycena vulgaris]|nr:hypothetical protein DFH09DRAFT_1270283 [Mycena vulgaris]